MQICTVALLVSAESFRRKCYVPCGHNIIYDMTLSTK